MATNFPVSLDSFTNPLGTDRQSTPSHSAQHSNANDAIEALQSKVGVDNSADGSTLDYKVRNTGVWTTYTPTVVFGTTAITLGNGTLVGRYTLIGDTVHALVRLTWGSTTNLNSGTGNLNIALPFSYNTAFLNQSIGTAYLLDNSATTSYRRIAIATDTEKVQLSDLAGTIVNDTNVFSPAAGDVIGFSVTYEVV